MLRNTILRTATPDRFYGRFSGIELAQIASVPSLESFEAGVVACLAGVRSAIVAGGILCVAGTAAIAAALPALLRYDAQAGRG